MATPQKWWSQTGSNRRPPACKAGALPTELWPRSRASRRKAPQGRPAARANARESLRGWMSPPASEAAQKVVGLGRLELPTSRLSSARSNQLSYKPKYEKTRAHAEAASVAVRRERLAALIWGNDDACPRDRKSRAFQKADPRSPLGSSVKKEKRRRRRPAKGSCPQSIRPRIWPDCPKRPEKGCESPKASGLYKDRP